MRKLIIALGLLASLPLSAAEVYDGSTNKGLIEFCITDSMATWEDLTNLMPALLAEMNKVEKAKAKGSIIANGPSDVDMNYCTAKIRRLNAIARNSLQ